MCESGHLLSVMFHLAVAVVRVSPSVTGSNHTAHCCSVRIRLFVDAVMLIKPFPVINCLFSLSGLLWSLVLDLVSLLIVLAHRQSPRSCPNLSSVFTLVSLPLVPEPNVRYSPV